MKDKPVEVTPNRLTLTPTQGQELGCVENFSSINFLLIFSFSLSFIQSHWRWVLSHLKQYGRAEVKTRLKDMPGDINLELLSQTTQTEAQANLQRQATVDIKDWNWKIGQEMSCNYEASMKWITRCRSLAARGEDEVGQKNIKSLFVFCLHFSLHNDFYNLDLGGFTIFSSSSSTCHGLSYCAWWRAHGEVQLQTHWKKLDMVSIW